MILAHWHRLKEEQIPFEGIELVKTAIAFSTTAPPPDITITGIQSGDLILWIQATDGGANQWSEEFNTGTGVLDMSGLVDGIAGYFISSGTSFTVSSIQTDNEATYGAYHYSVWRGVNATTPIDVTAQSNYGSTSSQPNPPSITTQTDNCIIVTGFMMDDRDSTDANVPTGYTLLNKIFGGAGDPTLYVVYKLKETAGVEDPEFTGATTGDRHHDFIIPLRPA